MRVAVILALLVNGVLYLWGQGYLSQHDGGREPERLTRQKSPEKLRIVPADEIKPETASLNQS